MQQVNLRVRVRYNVTPFLSLRVFDWINLNVAGCLSWEELMAGNAAVTNSSMMQALDETHDVYILYSAFLLSFHIPSLVLAWVRRVY